ncbi:MAG: hypothetical protein M3Q50_12920 [Chloroflexota bacterium]|nr:hypothetical protein [Chloroflexota bacterium]
MSIAYQQRQSIDAEPTVDVAIAWSERDRYWELTVVRCCYCGRRHYHGGGNGPTPLLGFRVPHCLDGRHPDYELMSTAEQGVAS